MSKHTEGPWLRDGRMVYALNEDGFNRFCVGVQGLHTPEAELIAVATLMQSAPDLLGALEEAIEELNQCCSDAYGEDYNNPKFNAVLAKARGPS